MLPVQMDLFQIRFPAQEFRLCNVSHFVLFFPFLEMPEENEEPDIHFHLILSQFTSYISS